MKKKAARLGESINSVKELKSYRRFVTPWYRLRNIFFFLRMFMILAFAPWHFFASPPTSMYGIVLSAFLASLFLDMFCFDYRDQRVYISDRDVVIKDKSLMLRYRWAHIKHALMLPDNGLHITFTDESEATLKGMIDADELLSEINRHIPDTLSDESH